MIYIDFIDFEVFYLFVHILHILWFLASSKSFGVAAHEMAITYQGVQERVSLT